MASGNRKQRRREARLARAKAASAAISPSPPKPPQTPPSNPPPQKLRWPKIPIKAEATAAILINVVSAGADMSWGLRLTLFFVACLLAFDLIRQMTRTTITKISIMILAVLLFSATFLPKTWHDFQVNMHPPKQELAGGDTSVSDNNGQVGPISNNYAPMYNIDPSPPDTASDGCSAQNNFVIGNFTVIKTNPNLSIFDLDGSKCANISNSTVDGPGNDISARDSFGLNAQNVHLNANWPFALKPTNPPAESHQPPTPPNTPKK